jgi:hypothetical protein
MQNYNQSVQACDTIAYEDEGKNRSLAGNPIFMPVFNVIHREIADGVNLTPLAAFLSSPRHHLGMKFVLIFDLINDKRMDVSDQNKITGNIRQP